MDKRIFGPVPSRRLGISLGIDVIPFKTCTLDCIYCECGRTTDHGLERKRFFNPDEVLEELNDYLKRNIPLDYITFSGSGEPTLNSDIGYIIREIKKISNVPVAVLTNGTLLYDKTVRDELLPADLVLPSLDAVSENIFRKINRPAKGLHSSEIIEGLVEFSNIYKGKIWLEVFFAAGVNDFEEELDKLYSTIKRISPDRVQLNSLDRPPAYKNTKAVDINFLEHVKNRWNDLNVDIIKRIRMREDIPSFSKNLEENILNTILRRPLTVQDLETLTGKRPAELLKYIDVLEKEKKIKPKVIGDKIFYTSK